MRYYHLDGSYHDHPDDKEFGWYLEDIVIDEAIDSFHQQNEDHKEMSRINKEKVGKSTGNCQPKMEDRYKSELEESFEAFKNLDLFENSSSDINPESIHIYKPVSKPTLLINKLNPEVKEETPIKSIDCQLPVEGFIENPEANFYKYVKNSKIPAKEDMLALINPINPESKALLSVISYIRYKKINTKETNEDVLRTINFKTTNSSRLINQEQDKAGFCLNKRTFPNASFLLENRDVDVAQQIAREIKHYHATKEENMMSLMMELIIKDLDCNLGDMSELNTSVNELSNTAQGLVDTSDLGNSINSSMLSREKGETKIFVNNPSRSDILSSIGLASDIDRNIDSFIQEKNEMHRELEEIKASFQSDQEKTVSLIDEAAALQNDLREATFLDNMIHLLNGSPEKVKNKRLPFKIFHDCAANANDNFII